MKYANANEKFHIILDFEDTMQELTHIKMDNAMDTCSPWDINSLQKVTLKECQRGGGRLGVLCIWIPKGVCEGMGKHIHIQESMVKGIANQVYLDCL